VAQRISGHKREQDQRPGGVTSSATTTPSPSPPSEAGPRLHTTNGALASPQTKSDPRRVVTYRSGDDVTVQAQASVDYARREGWQIVAEFEDVGAEAEMPMHERPGLLAALVFVAGRVDDPIPITGVLVDRFGRFGRDDRETLTAEGQFIGLAAPVLYSVDAGGPEVETVRGLFRDAVLLDLQLRAARMHAVARAKREPSARPASMRVAGRRSASRSRRRRWWWTLLRCLPCAGCSRRWPAA
jgi:hypothetical protein